MLLEKLWPKGRTVENKTGSEKGQIILSLERVDSAWRGCRSQSARSLLREVAPGSQSHLGASRGLQGEKWLYCFVGWQLWQQSG